MAISDWIKHVLGRFKRLVIVTSGVAAVIWFVFFDSYSLVMRVRNHREKAVLNESNEQLKTEIDGLESKLSKRLSDEEVERVAREEYHMSKKDETVYPIVKE
jgi:cell division protein FtsB